MNKSVLILALFLTGCITRQEIREQHCAHVVLDRHGAHRPAGAYGAWVRGDRCFCRLWNGRVVFEGALGDKWRPE